jgi:hypothetical protein
VSKADKVVVAVEVKSRKPLVLRCDDLKGLLGIQPN